MVSILLITGKNSKFFSKFIISYMKNTKNKKDVELLILANEGDTWNRDFCEYFNLNITYENWGMGRNGRHEYFNFLAKKAKGDWLWHMCDDHYLLPGYEDYLLTELKKYDSKDVHCIIPRVDNSGSISHILSRGWYETVGRIAGHMSVDSYINRVTENMVSSRATLLDRPVLHDFTVEAGIMTPEHTRTEVSPEHKFYAFTDQEVTDEIMKDGNKLWNKIK